MKMWQIKKLTLGPMTDITQGTIWKQLLGLFFPILLGTFFQQLYNTVDAVIVGRFLGKEALAAVGGGTGTLINLLVGFFVGLSAGATVIISQFYGARKARDVYHAVHTAFALAIVGGLVITVVSIWYAPFALNAINTPENVLPSALIYIRIYFAGVLPIIVYNIGAGIFRAVGDTRRPLYFLIAGTVINIVLDLLFIGVFGWGIAGAAWATVISQTASMLMTCVSLMRTTENYRLSPRAIRFSVPILTSMLKIGFPTGTQAVLYSISNILIQVNVNALGINIIAAWAAFERIDSIYWMTLSSFGIALTTFAGQNYGAEKYDRILKGTKQCVCMSASVTILLSIFLWFFGGEIYGLFTTDTAVVAEGLSLIRFLAPFFVVYMPIEILSGVLRGVGKTLVPTFITATGICLLRVIWLTVVVPFNQTIYMVIASYPITWIITASSITIYFLRKKWLPEIQRKQ